MTLTEGALRFSFGVSCTVVQYESWAFYQNQFQRISGTKAVDFLCINGGQTCLIEVKDYRFHPRTKPISLCDEVALKVRDTLAGLAAARVNASIWNNDSQEGSSDQLPSLPPTCCSVGAADQRAGGVGTMNRKQIQDAFFIVLLVGLSVAFIRLLSPYLVAVAVAVILALLLRHPLNWLLRKGVARGAATALVVVALMVLGAVFLILFGILLTSELEEGVRTIRSEWPKLLAWAQQRLPWMQALVEQYELEQRISDLLGNAASQILSLSQAALSSLAAGILRAVVVAFLVIYLLLEGENLVDRLYQLLPLDRTQTDQLMRRAAQTLDATVLGTLFIGVLEGTFGGLLFVLFGLPSATLWGLIMVLVSVLPLLGINAVIVPAGVVVIIMGDVGRGVGLIVVGVTGAAVSQNLLRPKLVGDRSGLHPALVLVATLGGLSWLGLVGFVIGPMLATLAMIAWEQFASRHGEDAA